MTEAHPQAGARAEAEDLIKRIGDDPRAVAERCNELLATDLAPAARSAVLRAAGLAARDASSIDHSIELLEEALEAGIDAGDAQLTAEATLSLTGSFALSGRLDAALDRLGEAPVDIDPQLTARWSFQRATILGRMGRSHESLAEFDRSIALLHATDDSFFLAAAHGNRGRLLLELGRPRAAEPELRAAYAAHRRDGDRVAAAYVLNNLGELALIQGDIVGALRTLGESRDELEALTNTPWEPETARCVALIEAGLFGEAEALAGRLVELMRDVHLELDRAEALLLRSRALLALGERDQARHAAEQAMTSFADQHRITWQLRAALTQLRASDCTTAAEALDLARRAGHLALELSEAERHDDAFDARAHEVIRLCEGGAVTAASDRLAALRRGANPDRIEHQVLLARTRAIVAAASGNRRAALRSIHQAVVATSRHRMSLGGTELALAGANHETSLHQLAADLVVDGSTNSTIFRYVELGRAASLRSPPVRRSADPAVDEAIGRVRALSRTLERSDGRDARAVQHDLTGAMRTLRQLERGRPGLDRPVHAPIALTSIRATLSDGDVIVSMFAALGRLRAQVIDHRSARTVDLGALTDWATAFAEVRTSLDLAAHGFTVLDDEIAAPLREFDAALARVLPDVDRCVIVPPRELMDAHWSALGELRSRSFSLAPSVHVWYDRRDQLRTPNSLFAVAGPGLAHAHGEVARIGAMYESPTMLTGNAATAAGVLRGVAGSDVAHLACHGRHRSGNALMSSLEVDDGPLLLAELHDVAALAPIIVLSACQGADFDAFGGETMGLVHTLLQHGAVAVIAGSGAIADTEHTVGLMERFHHGLVSGQRPADALLHARAATPLATAVAFNCYGVA